MAKAGICSMRRQAEHRPKPALRSCKSCCPDPAPRAQDALMRGYPGMSLPNPFASLPQLGAVGEHRRQRSASGLDLPHTSFWQARPSASLPFMPALLSGSAVFHVGCTS